MKIYVYCNLLASRERRHRIGIRAWEKDPRIPHDSPITKNVRSFYPKVVQHWQVMAVVGREVIRFACIADRNIQHIDAVPPLLHRARKVTMAEAFRPSRCSSGKILSTPAQFALRFLFDSRSQGSTYSDLDKQRRRQPVNLLYNQPATTAGSHGALGHI